MKRLALFFLALALLASPLLTTESVAQQPYPMFLYQEQHPIPYYGGGGYCYIKGRHSHYYTPEPLPLFTVVSNIYHFVGDPVFHGYRGRVYFYRGRHPIQPQHGGGYCQIHAPHRHAFSPMTPRSKATEFYRVTDGYYDYQGPFGRGFSKATLIDPRRLFVTPRYLTLHIHAGYRPPRSMMLYQQRHYPRGFNFGIVLPRPGVIIHRGPRPRVIIEHRLRYPRFKHRKFRKFKHRKHRKFRKHKHRKHRKYRKHKHRKHRKFRKHKHRKHRRRRW